MKSGTFTIFLLVKHLSLFIKVSQIKTNMYLMTSGSSANLYPFPYLILKKVFQVDNHCSIIIGLLISYYFRDALLFIRSLHMHCLGLPDVSSQQDVIFQCIFTTKTDDPANNLTIHHPAVAQTKKSSLWPAVVQADKQLSLAVSIGSITKYYHLFYQWF